MYPAFVFPGFILPARIDGGLSKQLHPDPSEGDGGVGCLFRIIISPARRAV